MIKPTDSELEILQVMWQYGPSTVRFINDILNKSKNVGYTTTLKLLQIMTQKGIVEVDKANRSHIYIALLKKNETQLQLVDELLQAAFGGSAKALVMQALGNRTPDKAEMDEIIAFINQMEKQ